MSTTDTTEPIEEPTITVAEIVNAVSVPLTAADRCDRCGAQAYTRVEIIDLGGPHLDYGVKALRPGTDPVIREILFCAHHYREHEDALKAQAKRILDETGVLASQEVPTL